MLSIFDRFGWRKAVIVRRDVMAAKVLNQSIDEVYRTQPALRAVVSFLAENAGSLPLKCYQRKSDTDRPRVTEGATAELLSAPNRWETLETLMIGTFSDYLLYGWALWYVVPSTDLASGWEMVRIPIPWIQDKNTVDGFSHYQYLVKNPLTISAPIWMDAADCIRIAAYDPNGQAEQCSPVEALKQVLAEQISAWDFRNSTWRNGGKIGGAYLKRPQGAEWSPEARKRFIESWKAKFSGKGDDTGGTPLLEDGMELVSTQFNAREAEWAEATKLARGDVAAVYHVNPALIWHEQSMTYASAKDNARALYADTLAPILTKVESALNRFLLPMIDAPKDQYLEFDLSAKLQGSFEEQAQVLQSAVGRPYILPNEARARMNLPSIDGGDELAMPLNMTTGTSGSDIQENGELAYVVSLKEGTSQFAVKQSEPVTESSEVRILSKASTSAERDISEVLDSFYKRQALTISNQLASMDPDDIVLDGYMDWWDKDRWVRELSTDLQKASMHPARDAANRVLDMLTGDHDGADLSKLDTDITNLCDFRADDIVQSTLERLTSDLRNLNELTSSSIRLCVEESYKSLQDGRVERNSQSMATAISNAGTYNGAKVSGYKCTKTWRSFAGARRSHARMNGETVSLDKRFSNGARWPGDTSLPPEETCNCRCRIEIKKTGGRIKVTTLEEHFYDGSKDNIKAEAENLRKEEAFYHDMFKHTDRSQKSYRETYGGFVMEQGKNLYIENYTRVEAKEIQLAKWFSNTDHKVDFRNPNNSNNKADVFLDGNIWEFKRITSSSPKKMARRVTEKLDRQGSRFVVDLSVCDMSASDAESKIIELLQNEDKIEQIMLVQDGKLKLFER